VRTSAAVDSFLVSRGGKGLSPTTLRFYRVTLDPFAASCPSLPIRCAKIEAFLANLTCGDERRMGYYRSLHALYRFLKRRRLIRSNPMEDVEPPKRHKKNPRFLTADELDQLLRYPHKPMVKASLLFLADTGCRVGELYRLQPGNFQETPEGWIAHVDGKSGQHIVPVGIETYRAILPFLPIRCSLWWLRVQVKQAFRDSHVPGSSKTLRHTFGTQWNGDFTALQKIMGHANMDTTLIYRHLNTARLSEQHNRFSPLHMVYGRTKSML